MSDSQSPPKVYPILPPGRTYLIENVKYKDQYAHGDTKNNAGPGSTDPPVYVAKQNNTPYEKWIVRGIEVFEGRTLPSDHQYYTIQNAGTLEYAWSKQDPQLADPVLDKTPRVWAIEAVTPIQPSGSERTEWVITPEGPKEDKLYWGVQETSNGLLPNSPVRLLEDRAAKTNRWYFIDVTGT